MRPCSPNSASFRSNVTRGPTSYVVAKDQSPPARGSTWAAATTTQEGDQSLTAGCPVTLGRLAAEADIVEQLLIEIE